MKLPVHWEVPKGVLIAASIAIMISCAKQKPTAEEWITEDGIRVVLSYTMFPYLTPWCLEQEFTVGEASGNDDYILRQPWKITFLIDGSILLLDSHPLQFRIYDTNGRFVCSFGQPGNGPTDLAFGGTNYLTLRPVASQQFEYWQGWPSVKQTWRTDGTLVSTLTFPRDHRLHSVGRPYRFGPMGEGIYAQIPGYAFQNSSEPPLSRIMITQWGGGDVRTLCELPEFDWVRLGDERISVAMAQATSNYTPMERFLFTDSKVYYSAIGEDWIQEYDALTGKETLRFRLNLESPMSISDEEVRFAGEGMKWWQENTWQAALVEGPEGEIWVQRTFEANEKGLWPTDVFDNNGYFRGRRELPFAPNTISIREGRLCAIGIGGEGHPTILCYRILHTE